MCKCRVPFDFLGWQGQLASPLFRTNSGCGDRARLGEKNEAMHWLERSYAQKEVDILTIRVNPFLDPLRGDPQFETLAQKVLPNQ
jgi:hypothetical protein